jgi:hypothetical protein
VVPVRVLARRHGVVARLGEAVTLTHGRTRKRYGEAAALVLLLISGAVGTWLLLFALIVLLFHVIT